MNNPPIATIINFCTIEARFIQACIEQCRHFSRQIIIPVCDHLFNGEPENRARLDEIYRAFPDCIFIEYPWIERKLPKRIIRKATPAHFWHNVSRILGSRFLDDSIEWVLFLDADELPDGKKFGQWLQESDYRQHRVMKMANYWYFREPRFQALNWEESVVFVNRGALNRDVLGHDSERHAIYDFLPQPKRKGVTGFDGNPMFHHFSWVRTKDEMLKKVQAWGHRHDRNWSKLVEQEFSGPFSGKDFVHGYSFTECTPIAEIPMAEFGFKPATKQPQVMRLTEKELIDHLGSQPKWLNKLFSFFSS